MNSHFDLDNQTAPESTRGLFDPPENSSVFRKSDWSDKRRTIELGSRNSKSFNKSNRHSGLHTVNEEDFYHAKQLDSIQRKQRSSVAHFNSFPIGKNLHEDIPLSRADVLAETEAKLSGQKLPYRDDKHNRRLSEPPAPFNKRMSFQLNSSDDKRLSLSRLIESDKQGWRTKSPSSRPNSTVGLMNYHRLSTGTIDHGHQRKPLFTSHLPFSSVVPHLKTNALVSGLLRVNKRNRSDAYVFCEELNADIYICGSRDRNRALEGDHVAVRLIEVEQVMLEKHEKEEAKLARNNGHPVIRKPDEEDEKEIIFGGEEDVDLLTPKYCGVVVAILDRAQKQMFSGTLGLTRPSNKRSKSGNDEQQRDSSQPRIIWFKPTDKRVPLIAIPVEQAPQGFIENPDIFENRIFLGSIKRWPITSLHPFGVLENELGLVNDISVQLQAILADNNLHFPPFSEALIQSIPHDLIQKEIPQRRDLRSLQTITIVDEEGGFLDKALSFSYLPDGSYEVGFHVSDISAFVPPDSPLDKEARQRGMDVYHTLIETVPLWPEELKKETDFVQGQDRLAFSVIWNIKQIGKVKETWYGKTVIQSSAVLKSSDIQTILDSEPQNGLEQDIVSLYTTAQLLHRGRSTQALFIEPAQLDIQYQSDGKPIQISRKKKWEADLILNEFQILANTQVAQKISSHFPDHALLRSQSAPNDRKLRDLSRYLESLGYTLHAESASRLQKSIESIQDEDARHVTTALVLKTLSPEKYFCTGAFDINRYHHYSTDAPLYSHFSSPAKRYPDLIVHRQLEAYLNQEPYFYLDSETVQKTAQYCNVKTRSIENAREQTQHLFLSYYLTCDGQETSRIHDAIVVGVQEGAFDVIVPSLGLERRIHTINLPIRSDTYSPSENVLHLVWIPGRPTVDGTVESHLHHDLASTNDDQLYDDDDEDGVLIDLSDDDYVRQLSVPSLDELKPNRRRSMSIRAIHGETPIFSPKDCTFPNEARQLIRPFDFIKVVVTADPVRNPPLIRILAANPFVQK